MLVIRLFRVGKKNQPSFKIVVTDKRKPPRAGRFLEEVGFYNPLTKEKVLKGERIKYWLSVGAKPSATIYNLLVKEKIIEGKKISVHKKSKKEPSATKPAEVKVTPVEPVVVESASVDKAAPAKETDVAAEPASASVGASAGKEKPAEEPKKEDKTE